MMRLAMMITRSWIALGWKAGSSMSRQFGTPVRQLTEYLEILFEASENVGYVTASWEKDGKYLPSKGSWDRTAGELIERLNHCGGGHWGRPGRLQSAGGGLDPLQSHGR